MLHAIMDPAGPRSNVRLTNSLKTVAGLRVNRAHKASVHGVPSYLQKLSPKPGTLNLALHPPVSSYAVFWPGPGHKGHKDSC